MWTMGSPESVSKLQQKYYERREARQQCFLISTEFNIVKIYEFAKNTLWLATQTFIKVDVNQQALRYKMLFNTNKRCCFVIYLNVFLPSLCDHIISAMQDWTTCPATLIFLTPISRELSMSGGDWNLPSSSEQTI